MSDTDTSREAVEALMEGVPEGPWWSDAAGYIWANGPKGEFTPLQVRGWGYYTGGGVGALGLPHKEAFDIQDRVGKFAAASRELVPALLSERDAAVSELATLKAERERLREALIRIAAMPPAGAYMCGSVARDALDALGDA